MFTPKLVVTTCFLSLRLSQVLSRGFEGVLRQRSGDRCVERSTISEEPILKIQSSSNHPIYIIFITNKLAFRV